LEIYFVCKIIVILASYFQITKNYGPTGAEYLFLNKNGELTAYSLITGLKVLKMVHPKNAHNDGMQNAFDSSMD
jgi:methionine salvage enolase-phosphatase E1